MASSKDWQHWPGALTTSTGRRSDLWPVRGQRPDALRRHMATLRLPDERSGSECATGRSALNGPTLQHVWPNGDGQQSEKPIPTTFVYRRPATMRCVLQSSLCEGRTTPDCNNRPCRLSWLCCTRLCAPSYLEPLHRRNGRGHGSIACDTNLRAVRKLALCTRHGAPSTSLISLRRVLYVGARKAVQLASARSIERLVVKGAFVLRNGIICRCGSETGSKIFNGSMNDVQF